MSKKLLFKVLVGLLFVAMAVTWLLSEIMPEQFADIELAWLITVFACALGALFIVRGLFGKNVSVAKKMNIFAGCVLIVAGVLALVGTFIAENLILPIIAIGLTVMVLLSVLAVGGKKWDSGDNQKVGYKNYYQRKKEQEEKEGK